MHESMYDAMLGSQTGFQHGQAHISADAGPIGATGLTNEVERFDILMPHHCYIQVSQQQRRIQVAVVIQRMLRWQQLTR